MTPGAYKKQFSEEDAVGWLAIDKELERLYPDQKPKHFAPPLHYIAGGQDPLDGISLYKNPGPPEHDHFVSYGLSELYYNEEKAGGVFSKWGFELTFRLKPFAADNGEPHWVLSLMQNLARYVFDTGKWFEEFHFIPTNGPVRVETDTDIVALAFITDPQLGKIDTPHGELSFLQMVGITGNEYEILKQNPTFEETEKLLNRLKENNPLLITDLERK